MKTYKFNFIGVLNGSIGKRYKYSKTVQAENITEAHLKLYDTHEHISITSVNGKKVNKDYDLKALDN